MTKSYCWCLVLIARYVCNVWGRVFFFKRETEEASSGEEKAGFMKATLDMSVQKETWIFTQPHKPPPFPDCHYGTSPKGGDTGWPEPKCRAAARYSSFRTPTQTSWDRESSFVVGMNMYTLYNTYVCNIYIDCLYMYIHCMYICTTKALLDFFHQQFHC